MATKIPKATSDAGIGLQSLNALDDNIDELKEGLADEHTFSVVPIGGATTAGRRTYEGADRPGEGASRDISSPITYGAHSHPLIPRGIAYVGAVPTNPNTAPVALLWAEGCVGTMQVTGTGSYFFPIAGLANIWAHVTAYGAGGVTEPTIIKAVPTTMAGVVGVGVFTSQVADAAGVPYLNPVDVGFYLRVYGDTVLNAPWDPSAGALPFTEFESLPRRGRRVIPWHGFVRV